MSMARPSTRWKRSPIQLGLDARRSWCPRIKCSCRRKGTAGARRGALAEQYPSLSSSSGAVTAAWCRSWIRQPGGGGPPASSCSRALRAHGDCPIGCVARMGGSEGCWRYCASRLRALGVRLDSGSASSTGRRKTPTWYSLAALDAATRMVATLVRADALSRGSEAADTLLTVLDRADEDQSPAQSSIR